MKATAYLKLALPALCALLLASPVHAQLKKVPVQVDWIVNGSHIGFFVAKARGFYAARGLDPEINRGYGSGDTAKIVGAGKVDFGVLTIPVAITSRGNGAPLVSVAVLYGKAPESFVSFEGKPVRLPRDVEGKSFVEAPAGSLILYWPAFAQLAGIDTAKVQFIGAEPASKLPVFFSGQADFVIGFRPSSDATTIVQARKQGKKLVFVTWENYGWKTYGLGLVTSDQVLKRDPKLVADFVAATMEGYRWAMENLDPALDMLTKAFMEVDRTTARLEMLFTFDGMLTKGARESGLGYMEPDRIAFQIDLMSRLLKFPAPKVDDVYTNRFIETKPLIASAALQAEIDKVK
jgi:NitT/TauT family transport system substrate-binding protein